MASSRLVNSEIGYALRWLLSSVPALRAPAEERSGFYLMKAEIYEALAATDPAIAAQAMEIADKARREAHAIILDY